MITRVLLKYQPTISYYYKSRLVEGTYPFGPEHFINILANMDRIRIQEFFAACNGGLFNKTLVTNIQHLHSMKEVNDFDVRPHHYVDPFAVPGVRAFMMPNVSSSVQISAQFEGVTITRDAKPLVFTLTWKGHPERHVTLSGTQIYDEFERKCICMSRRMQVIRKLYRDTSNPQVLIKSTSMSGHKLWIHIGQGELVTLYIVKQVHKKGNVRLMVVAVDIKVNNTTLPVECSQSECPICFEVMESGKTRECAVCKNAMHEHCAEMWKQKNATCPLCRSSF